MCLILEENCRFPLEKVNVIKMSCLIRARHFSVYGIKLAPHPNPLMQGKDAKGKDNKMETRVAIISIIVENDAVICDIQNLLTEYSQYVIGRFGIPYKQKDIRIISVVLDAPVDIINALTGKIGRLEHVNAKTVYSNV